MLKKVLLISVVAVVLIFIALSFIAIPAPTIEITKEIPITQQGS